MHGLREAGYLADRKGNVCRVALKVILPGKPVLRTEVVIEIPVDLVGVKLARRALHERIESLAPAFRVRRIRQRDDELTARRLGVEDGQRHGIHLIGRNACRTAGLTSIIGIHQVYKSRLVIPICVRQTLKSRHAIKRAAESVADALSLV